MWRSSTIQPSHWPPDGNAQRSREQPLLKATGCRALAMLCRHARAAPSFFGTSQPLQHAAGSRAAGAGGPAADSCFGPARDAGRDRRPARTHRIAQQVLGSCCKPPDRCPDSCACLARAAALGPPAAPLVVHMAAVAGLGPSEGPAPSGVATPAAAATAAATSQHT